MKAYASASGGVIFVPEKLERKKPGVKKAKISNDNPNFGKPKKPSK